jgi:ketosteroid isomerase-like protein
MTHSITVTLFSRASRLRVAGLVLVGILGLAATATASDTDRAVIDSVLDDFHAAAAAADRERYLGHFSDDGVFMGTDDWERWPLDEFEDYVAGRFENGGGWEYHPEARHIAFAPDGNTAWFDEIAVSPRWGRFRGTGVMLRQGDSWKIAHYSLTALVPNEQFRAVSEITRPAFEARKNQTSPGG